MLPLAALVVFYLLVADTFVARSRAALETASYGRPFAWITQDLSRYDAGEFPRSIPYNWTSNWSDPVPTDVNWLVFAVDATIVCIAVTALYFALVYGIRWFTRELGRSS